MDYFIDFSSNVWNCLCVKVGFDYFVVDRLKIVLFYIETVKGRVNYLRKNRFYCL